MKRGMAFIAAALLSVCFAFAEGSYVVKSVKGSVRYEVSAGKLQNVKVGQTINLSTYLNVAPNASVVLTVDGKDVTITGMKKNTLDKLLPKDLKNSGAISNANVSGNASSRSGVNTASQRADIKSEEMDWGSDDDGAAVDEEVPVEQ